MRQWAEDVDALRAQLVAERRAWESDRSELEDVVVELEDELQELKVNRKPSCIVLHCNDVVGTIHFSENRFRSHLLTK